MSSTVVVPKRQDVIRLCVDYKRTVNKGIDINHYPLPVPDDIFASLMKVKFSVYSICQEHINSGWWLKLSDDIEKLILQCKVCQLS